MSYDSFYFPNLSVDSMDVGSGVQSKRGTLANPRVKDWLNNILQSGGGSSMDTFGQPTSGSPVTNNDPLAGQGAYGYNGAVPWERLTPQQRIDWAKGQPGTADLFTARQSQKIQYPNVGGDNNYWDSVVNAIASNGQVPRANIPKSPMGGEGYSFDRNNDYAYTLQHALGAGGSQNETDEEQQARVQRVSSLYQKYGPNWQDMGYDVNGNPNGEFNTTRFSHAPGQA